MTAPKNDNENVTQESEESSPEQPEVAADGEETEQEPTDPIEKLELELHKAQIAAVEARQDMLRMQADMDNLRKRLVREHEKTRLRTLERFMNDLLPVRDSLERGLEAASDPSASVETLIEGKQLIMKMLTKAKEKSEHQLHSLKRDNNRIQERLQSISSKSRAKTAWTSLCS